MPEQRLMDDCRTINGVGDGRQQIAVALPVGMGAVNQNRAEVRGLHRVEAVAVLPLKGCRYPW